MALIYISLILFSYILSEDDGQFLRRSLIAIILIFISLSTLCFIDDVKYLKFNRNILSITIIAIIFINYTNLLNRHIADKNDIFDKSINEIAITNQKYFNFIPGLNHYYDRTDMILIPDPRESRHIKLINTIRERRCIIDKIDCLKGKFILTTTPIIVNNTDFIAPFTSGFVNEVLQKNNFGIGPIHVNKGENFYEILNQRNINFVMIELSENITQDDLDKSKDVAYNFTADVIKRYSAGLKDKLVFVDSFRVYSQKMIILKNIGIE